MPFHLRTRLALPLLIAFIAAANGVARAEDPGKPLPTFTSVTGRDYHLPGPNDCKALALIFFGYDCPISNAYAPEIARLHKEFSAKGVSFCLVYADADIALEDARKHAKEYGFPCDAILDPELVLAKKVGATVKPEAAVLSPKGELLYRGRIDDLYPALGKKRPQPTQRNLQDALTAILDGKPVAVERTKSVGCTIYFPEPKRP